ncbi:MAG: hypothetical protein C0418_03715 [Coriobacteriaceae bacterium]|nr:hypothetical protein [Coriobacteriaceae bacterium]
MRVKVRKVGNSLTITVPKAMARELALYEGVELEYSIRDGALVVSPLGSRWERLCADAQRHAREMGLTEDDVMDAIDEIRGRR